MNGKSIDSKIFAAINEDKEIEFLEKMSVIIKASPILESEFKFYKEVLTKYEHYNNDLALSKYMACKDMIIYFKSTDLTRDSLN